jgi:hypothetical protein
VRICQCCKKECVGSMLVFPGLIDKGAHPRCAVKYLLKSKKLPYRGITPEVARDPKFLLLLESIAEDPSRGKRRRHER